jgi:N-acetylmuramoyl-L-alanine amidase
LGEDIVENISEVTGLQNRGMKARPGLYVLKRTAMPAVLVELGFITNPSDSALMNNNPQLFAEGIYRGIVDFTGLA